MNTDKKETPKEIFKRLVDYPEYIKAYEDYQLEAVKRYLANRAGDLHKEYKRLINQLPETVNMKDSQQWLAWYEQAVEPGRKSGKYLFEHDIEIEYNGIVSDVEDFKFIVWPDKGLSEPVLKTIAFDVAQFLKREKQNYIITDYFDTSYLDIRKTIDAMLNYIEWIDGKLSEREENNNQEDEFAENKKLTAAEAVEKVEQIRRETDCTYPKAIDVLNKEIGYIHFQDYNSFKSSRYKQGRGY